MTEVRRLASLIVGGKGMEASLLTRQWAMAILLDRAQVMRLVAWSTAVGIEGCIDWKTP